MSLVPYFIRFFCFISLFAACVPAYSDYRKALELYKQDELKASVREFQRTARTKQFDGYQDVIRDLIKLERSYDPAANRAIIESLGVAAENGPAEAQWLMSRLWIRFGGDMPTRDPGRVRWLTLAAKNGFADAAWELYREPQLNSVHGRSITKSAEDIAWLRRAAELGHDRAQIELAILYMRGSSNEVSRDVQQAMYWARKRAEKADPSSLASASYVYRLARPEERKSYPEAIEWLRGAWNGGRRDWHVARSLVDLVDEKQITDASAEEVGQWRKEAARLPPIR